MKTCIERTTARMEPPVLVVPKHVSLSAYEFGAIWEVRAREHRLYYPVGKCVVPFDAELIVEFVEGNQAAAEQFACQLRTLGHTDVTTQMMDQHHVAGECVA